MDLATKKVDFLTPDTADVDDFDLSPDGKTIAYVTNEKGVERPPPVRHGDAAGAARARSCRWA